MKAKKILIRLLSFGSSAALLASQALAGDLSSSTVVSGTTALVGDVTTVLAGMSIAIGGGAATYFLIRKSMSDEADGKVWQKRIITAIVCGIGGVLASGIVSLIASYYGA